MKRAVSAVLLLFVCTCLNAVAQQSENVDPWQGAINAEAKTHPAGALTNESIVKLVRAGLDEDTIIAMVNTQPGNFTLGVKDVIALKRAGVSDAIIGAMVHRSAGRANHPMPDSPRVEHGLKTPRSSPAELSPAVPDEAGLYAVDSTGDLSHIVGRVTSFDRSGSLLGSLVTGGIHASRINTQIPGRHARVTVGARPVFYYRTPGSQEVPGLDLVLTRMTVKDGRRQFEVAARGFLRGSNGVSVRHQIDYQISEIAPGLYKLTPSRELDQGQYAFYMLRGFEHSSTQAGQGFVFDFQVE